jgi:hypothetical protein
VVNIRRISFAEVISLSLSSARVARVTASQARASMARVTWRYQAW